MPSFVDGRNGQFYFYFLRLLGFKTQSSCRQSTEYLGNAFVGIWQDNSTLQKQFLWGLRKAALEDVNLLIASDGANGSRITAVPEPTSLGLVLLAGLALLSARRRN